MLIEERIKAFNGRLSLTAFDSSGKELWKDTGNNLIVDSGYQALARCLIGDSDAQLSHIEIGTDKSETKPTDTEITGAEKVEIQEIEYTSTGIRFHFTIALNDVVGMPISEFGLITKGGELFARKVRQPIEKTEYMVIMGVWEVNFMDK